MSEKIKPMLYRNTPVEFKQAVAILENYGYTVKIQTEYRRYSRFVEPTLDKQYAVMKDGKRPFVWSDMHHFRNNDVRYGEVFYACFQVLDNQAKDRTLKTTLGQLDVGVF